ncbi:hypothetical protein CYMTET_21938 [Cymbomonas tetramitiformis]|uniref:CWF21 domain-containing protein n=1 Tax=Cymbomonas tetramitiformis TaxID=36881 RepID=A0AAE0L2S7_9CHLO|nr:hypothetical protein CYMTET_21938 [Cymbomonas tetramitiformis]
MYNGVGIHSARGSGSSGYVQSNKFHLLPHRRRHKELQDLKEVMADTSMNRQPNKDILEHSRKRAIEVELMKLRADLEDKGFADDDIDIQCDVRRKELEAKAEEEPAKLSQETHQVALRKEKEMDKIRSAFGITETNEGDAFDRDLQETKKNERIAERERADEEKREAEIRREQRRIKDEKKKRKEAKREAKEEKRREKEERKRAEREKEEEEERKIRAEKEARRREKEEAASKREEERRQQERESLRERLTKERRVVEQRERVRKRDDDRTERCVLVRALICLAFAGLYRNTSLLLSLAKLSDSEVLLMPVPKQTLISFPAKLRTEFSTAEKAPISNFCQYNGSRVTLLTSACSDARNKDPKKRRNEDEVEPERRKKPYSEPESGKEGSVTDMSDSHKPR